MRHRRPPDTVHPCPPHPTPNHSHSRGPQTGPSTGACKVGYAVTNQWPGGFQASVTVTNTGTAAVTGWRLGWSFTAGEKISSLWSADYTQSGAAVTVTAPSWSTSIPPGGNAVFGFGGTVTDSAAAAFTLNGTACARG